MKHENKNRILGILGFLGIPGLVGLLTGNFLIFPMIFFFTFFLYFIDPKKAA